MIGAIPTTNAAKRLDYYSVSLQASELARRAMAVHATGRASDRDSTDVAMAEYAFRNIAMSLGYYITKREDV